MYLPKVSQRVGTVTCAASGVGSIIPATSNTPFKNLSISVRPVQDNTRYTVGVYFNGELEEEHTYSTAADRVVAHFMFPNTIFPANISANTIPVYYESGRRDYRGLPVMIQIQNNEADRRTFEVYAMFETYSNCDHATLTQEE